VVSLKEYIFEISQWSTDKEVEHRARVHAPVDVVAQIDQAFSHDWAAFSMLADSVMQQPQRRQRAVDVADRVNPTTRRGAERGVGGRRALNRRLNIAKLWPQFAKTESTDPYLVASLTHACERQHWTGLACNNGMGRHGQLSPGVHHPASSRILCRGRTKRVAPQPQREAGHYRPRAAIPRQTPTKHFVGVALGLGGEMKVDGSTQCRPCRPRASLIRECNATAKAQFSWVSTISA
jgi:hypothetical protein